MSDKTIKGAHLRCSNSPQSQPSEHHHRKSPAVYGPKRRANNGVANERGLYIIISITYKEYYPKGFVTA